MFKNRKQSMDSHLKQFRRPLYSTVMFEKFLDKHNCFTVKEVLDIGCGCAAVTSYMAARHPETHFVGADYNKFLIKTAKDIPFNRGIGNLEFKTANLMNPPPLLRNCDGIYSVHTLCCFKRIEGVIDSLSKLNPEWIAFNSLFYEGPLDVLVHIRDHERPEIKDDNPDGDFNIFSLHNAKSHFEKRGYRYFYFEKFEIPKEIKKPAGGRRGTYTIKSEISPRTQFSGPVYLPWYFVLASKKPLVC